MSVTLQEEAAGKIVEVKLSGKFTKWEAGMALFCKPFTTAKVRYFDESKATEAQEWISEGIAQPV